MKSLLWTTVLSTVATLAASTPVADRYIVQLHDTHELEHIQTHLVKRGAEHAIRHRFARRDIFHGFSVETREPHHLYSFEGTKNVWQVQSVPGPPLVYNPSPSNYTKPPKKGFGLIDPVSVSNQATAAGGSFTGFGVKVAVIDTGIDYRHPALGNFNTPRKERSCLGASPCKTLKGFDYVGNYFNDPSRDTDPFDDCNGHGTGVAGVIGAATRDGTDGMVGVAPDVKFLAYRVFSCPDFDGNSPSGSDDDIIAAISQAVADGADIINLSLGGPSGWAGSPTSVAVDNAVAKGKAVFVAAGNDGGQGPLYASSPGSAKTGVSIGAFRNELYPQWRFRAQPAPGSDAASIAATEATRSFWYIGKHLIGAQVNIGFPIVQVVNTAAACPEPTASPSINFANAIVVELPLASCSLSDYFKKLKGFGASGDSRSADSLPGIQEVADAEKIRFGLISTNAEAQRLITMRNNDPSNFQIEFPVEVAKPFITKESQKGSKMEQFSSVGPKWDIKQEIGQPSGVAVSAAGGQIATLAPQALGSFAIMDGTSFATPYAAGCAALFYEAWKSLGSQRSSRMKWAFIQTAIPIFVPPAMTSIAPLHQSGAGRLAVNDAINARTFFSTNWHELGQSSGLQKRYIPVHNADNKAITYSVTHRPALDMILYQDSTSTQINPENQVNTRAPGAVKVVLPVTRFTVPAGEVRNLEIQYNIPAATGRQRVAYSGYIQLLGNDKRPSMRLPYSGITGKLETLNVIDRTTTYTSRQLPFLTHSASVPNIDTVPANGAPTLPASARAPSGDTFNVAAGDFPTIIYRLNAGAQVVRWNVWNEAMTSRLGHLPGSLGRLDQWRARTKGVAYYTSDRTFEYIQWDGIYNAGLGIKQVPERTGIQASGRVRLQLSVLRPGGLKSNAKDYDSWFSVPMNIVRSTPDKKKRGERAVIDLH
ncbi:hypothetical protein OIV83_002917 [Microbotryomycetes sp. JL201]|nr:hypothetical protein OIV83_002917 [Microbotryomycetes sp. JL201]